MLTVESEMPWGGKSRMTVSAKGTVNGTIKLRIPRWARNQPVPGTLFASSLRGRGLRGPEDDHRERREREHAFSTRGILLVSDADAGLRHPRLVEQIAREARSWIVEMLMGRGDPANTIVAT